MPHVSDADLELVTGAFWRPDVDLFRALLAATAAAGRGDLAELGVLYGRSAVLIGSSLGPGETCTVVDLFEGAAGDAENQRENEQSYPDLTRAAFEENYRALLGTLPVVVQGPSASITEHAAAGTHRFVHVDASHLFEHVVADIGASRVLLRPDGVLVLDDFRAAHTPGVAAAAWAAVAEVGLRPFALTPFKMYATWGDPEPWRVVAERTAAQIGVEHEVQEVQGTNLSRLGPVREQQHWLKEYLPPVTWPALARVRARARRSRRDRG